MATISAKGKFCAVKAFNGGMIRNVLRLGGVIVDSQVFCDDGNKFRVGWFAPL